MFTNKIKHHKDKQVKQTKQQHLDCNTEKEKITQERVKGIGPSSKSNLALEWYLTLLKVSS